MTSNMQTSTVDQLLQQGMELAKTGKTETAIHKYQEALRQSPDNPYAQHLLGAAEFKKGNTSEALRLASAAITNKTDEPVFYLLEGQIYESTGAPGDALESYKRARKLHPDHASPHFYCGTALRSLGRHDEAIAAFRAAIAVDPSMAMAYLKLGQILTEQGRINEAIDYLRTLTSIKPELLSGHLELGSALKANGEYEVALKSFDNVLAISPESEQAYIRKGEIYLAQGNYPDARKTYHELYLLKRGSNLQNKKFLEPKKAARQITDSPIQLSKFFLENFIGHIDYLIGLKKIDTSFSRQSELFTQVLNEIDDHDDSKDFATLNKEQADIIRPLYDRAVYYSDSAEFTTQALNEHTDFHDIEDQYLDAKLPAIAFDNFLGKEALNSLRDFCLESTIFFRLSHNIYISSLVYEGFNCSALYKIASELKQKFPRVLGDKELRNMWAYRHPAKGDGVRPHSDQASVTFNFWITPDEANLDPEHGGLVVYDRMQPMEWDWHKTNFNKDSPEVLQRINQFLESSETITVPYRENRAVLFHSNLFHASDRFHFKDNYIDRRMNITLLFGERE